MGRSSFSITRHGGTRWSGWHFAEQTVDPGGESSESSEEIAGESSEDDFLQ